MAQLNSGKDWLHNHHRKDVDDEDEDSLSVDSNDTLHEFINFESKRNSSGLEESICVSYPFPANIDIDERELTISTLLEEDDIAPLFDGACWAGTRVWGAAIFAIKYLIENHGNSNGKQKSLCELGCGLGVPGMIWHQFGGDVVLSEQEQIMSQLRSNTISNFEKTTVINNEELLDDTKEKKIQCFTLDWSRDAFQDLLIGTRYTNGFDIILNCDCVFEPLYGESWKLLVEVIDESLKVNPQCTVITSVERRRGDGIDSFIESIKKCKFVGSVDLASLDEKANLELYVTKGISAI